jgi:UDP-N-acetylmuramoyl-L-alanyl-D-glutamate--2,6-diaminopimelate ligase
LHQQRVSGVFFNVAAFTNLTQDHLDYHQTMDAYGEAKARLFRDCVPSHRVINVDDAFGRRLAAEFPGALTVSTGRTNSAQIWVDTASFGNQGVVAEVQVFDERLKLESRLLGRHNLENLLVAWGILHSLNVPPGEAARALTAARGVSGRMERCDTEEDDIAVVVDYAHTPDALSRALLTLVELDFTEVICVFGCGGDRDRKKRAPMGEIAARLSTRAYLTSDNPRSEDPLTILEEVRQGMGKSTEVIVEVDRRASILRAIQEARPGGVVLVAGKGHEDYQLVGDEVLSFDDRLVASEALLLRRGRSKADEYADS